MTVAKRVPRRKPGRPRALTADVRKRVLRLLKTGAIWTSVCQGAGIPYSTLQQYLSPSDDKFDAGFAEQCKAAQRSAIERLEKVVMKAASAGDWRAARWRLERLVAEYGPKVTVETSSTTRIEIQQSLAIAADVRKDPARVAERNDMIVELSRATPALPAAEDKKA